MKSSVLYAAFDLVPSPKGASTHITYFVRGLVAAGYQVTLITAGDPARPGQETYEGAILLRAPAGDDPNFLARAMAFGRFTLAHAATHAYDIIHVRSVWSGFPLVQQRAVLPPFKLLYEVNGLPSVEMKYHYPAVRGTIVEDKLREQELATLLAADAIVCPAQVTAAYITSLGVPPTKVTVIPNGIDPALFYPTPPTGPRPGEPATILYVGTLADWQGLDTLVHALPQLLADQPVQVRIVGRGRKRQRKQLLKLATKLGVAEALHLAPAVRYEAIPALIAQADICVAPLGYNDRNVTQGCCPIKLLEYMACARPVVAANLPVVRELACPGRDALLFTPGDPDDLARQILTLLHNPTLAADLSRQASQHTHAHFTWQLAQEQLLAVYQNHLA